MFSRIFNPAQGTSVQTEAILNVVRSVEGKVYATQPAKSVKSSFTEHIKEEDEITTLIESNDPFAYASSSSSSSADVITIATNAKTVFKNIPFLNSLKNSSVVIHAELPEDDFSIVTALKDFDLITLLSNNTKESQDLAIAAYAISSATSKAVLHFFSPLNDEKVVSLKSKSEITSIVDQFKNIGTVEEITKSTAEIIIEALKAVGSYKPFEYSGPSSVKDALVILGNVADELSRSASSKKAGVLNIRVYRPFLIEEALKELPKSVTKISVVEQTSSKSLAQFPSLLLDFFNSFDKLVEVGITSVVSAQLADFDDASVAVSELLENLRSESPVQNLIVGDLVEQAHLGSIVKGLAISKAQKLEDAYFKILKQVFNDDLNLLNEFSKVSEQIGSETTPEFGFGKLLYQEEAKKEFDHSIREAISNNSFQGPKSAELTELLSKWLIEQSNALVPEIIELLKADESEFARSLLEQKEYFSTRSSWLVGSDAWSYDLGSSGIHHLIASGKNVNALVIDSEPYELVKKNKSLYRKKDIGLYAMNFGGVYVASVSVYSSYTQVLQALIEADKFNGPSIVLAYLPYYTENDTALTILQESKKAVDSGYWPLYRFNPDFENSSEDSFKLDSSNLKRELQDFLDRENKLTLLTKKDPVLSRNITSSLSNDVKAKQNVKAREAFDKLLEGLSGPPLTIAFASDGGNAESLAKRLGRRGSSRGLKTIVVSMDDISIEDLPNETNIVFITSTSGQGEFPQNGKNLWDALRNSLDLDLASIKYSVFGLGDSQYWPRKEDKHYYNKPAVDLFKKLQLFGAQELAPLGLGDDQDADGYQTGYAEWEPKIWEALGVAGAATADEPAPITNEDIKIASNFLRGTIVEGLADQSTGAISASDQQLTKFHGIYMQDDRDIRDQRKAEGKEPAYAFMARVRLPNACATPRQWIKIDELADVRGNGTMKITTRATFQLHGLFKHNLKAAIRGMNSVLMDTLAACGDVNRNVMVSAIPHNAKIHEQIAKSSYVISEYLLPQTTAYHEIWLQGADENDSSPNDPAVWEARKDGPKKQKTMVAGNALVDYEPMYGPTYLPRKFKVVITVPPYNDVDVWAHDVGLIAIVDDEDNVLGYNVTVGGGMGTTHNNKKTYPRTGSMFGYVPYDKVHLAIEQIMIVQRDNGDRKNRKHARLKYTIDDLGIDVYKSKVEEQLGWKFEEPRPYEITSNVDHFGWTKDETGLNHFTCFVENGRVEDTPELPQKTGLREIAHYMEETQQGEFRLTGNQHLVISKISDSQISKVKELMAKYKLDNTSFSGLRLSSAACVALPTCGLAMAESERYLPVLIGKLESALEEYGLRHDSVVMRMTGCPNGCARPWLAEVALVGKAPGAYNLLLGGGHYGQRINKLYRSSIKEDEILAVLKPLFKRWSLERNENEPFGDFCIRVGIIKPTTEGKYFHDDVDEDAI